MSDDQNIRLLKVEEVLEVLAESMAEVPGNLQSIKCSFDEMEADMRDIFEIAQKRGITILESA